MHIGRNNRHGRQRCRGNRLRDFLAAGRLRVRPLLVLATCQGDRHSNNCRRRNPLPVVERASSHAEVIHSGQFAACKTAVTSIWYCTFATGATIILAIDPAMIPGSDRPALPARLIPAHYAIAALSLLALIIVQTNWDALFVQSAIETWPIYIAVLILAATAWLLSTAWLHLAIARQRSRPLAPQPGRAALHAVTDLLVAASATAVLLQGHRSPLALAGLWAVPPALLAISAPSAVLLLAVAYRKRPAAHAPQQRRTLDLLRLIVAATLLIAL